MGQATTLRQPNKKNKERDKTKRKFFPIAIKLRLQLPCQHMSESCFQCLEQYFLAVPLKKYKILDLLEKR